MKDIKGRYARACEYSLLLYSSIFWFYIDSVSPLLLLFLFFYFYYLFILSISSENEYIQLMAGGFPFALFLFFFILSISIITRFQSAVDVMIWSMYLSLMNHSLSQSGWNESSLWHLFATLYYMIAGSQMAILVIIQLLLVFSVLTSRAQIRKFYYL